MLRKMALVAVAALALAGCDNDTVKLVTNLPKDKNVLFWTQDQRDAAFRQLEKLSDANTITAGVSVTHCRKASQ